MIRPASRGFSLIEIMVAIFVLAVGMLGVGALQVTSKRANFEAAQRATAAAMAQDVVERMRTNANQLAVYTNAGVGYTLTGSTLSPVDCSIACSPAQLALHDLAEFERTLAGVAELTATGTNAGGLTSPTACVTGPNGGSGNYTVTIAWRGLTRLANPTLSTCGAGSGLYDASDANDVYRRLLVLDTFIVQPI